MNNLEQSYKKILEVLSKFFGKKLQDYQRRKPVESTSKCKITKRA